MTRTAWFNCSAGVAGDMLLAALVDAGADRLAVMDSWSALGVGGFAATWERVERCGVSSLWTNLVVDHDGDVGAHIHRPAREVLALIADADLDPAVVAMASAVYRTLAAVEGEVHGIDPDEVELHEVGALDSILDVVGVCAALADLGVERIVHSPIAVGHGTVATHHGTLPNPVPAVSRLLERAHAAVVGIDTTMELATPTGVALVTELGERCGPLPAMSVTATGFGAGTADPPGRPNVVQAVIGVAADADATPGPIGPDGASCIQIETNVDDVTGEVLAHTVAVLLDAGANDAWITPIVMKKGRPAHTVHALCDESALAAVRSALVGETGTLGVRAWVVSRRPQLRREITVTVRGHPIRVKVADHRIKVEHDDAAATARALGVPLRDVLADAERIAARGRAETPGLGRDADG